MKRKFIFLGIFITALIITLSCTVFRKSMRGFSSYSATLIDMDLSYDIPPSPYMGTVYLENIPAAATYDGQVFYALSRYGNGTDIFSYLPDKGHTEKIAGFTNDINDNTVYGISVNKDYILVVTANYITSIDRKNGFAKKLLNIYDFSNICIYDDSVYYSDNDGNVIRFRLDTFNSKIIEDVKSFLFIIDEGNLYYSDNLNEGKLSVFNINTGEITTNKSGAVTGFIREGGIISFVN